jgi:hypothetical protein
MFKTWQTTRRRKSRAFVAPTGSQTGSRLYRRLAIGAGATTCEAMLWLNFEHLSFEVVSILFGFQILQPSVLW